MVKGNRGYEPPLTPDDGTFTRNAGRLRDWLPTTALVVAFRQPLEHQLPSDRRRPP